MTRKHALRLALGSLLFLSAVPLLLGSRTPYNPKGGQALPVDVRTVVISAHTRDLTDSSGTYTEWPAEPDQVVLNNSTGTDAMFYDNIRFSSVTPAVRDSNESYSSYLINAYSAATQAPYWTGSDTVMTHLFLKFNMDAIPRDATIISAKLCLTVNSNITAQANSFFYAILDTAVDDTGWYIPSSPVAGNGLMRRATWNRMRQGDATSGWAANGACPFRWRDDLWDYGIPCNIADGPASTTAGAAAVFDVSKPLQWWLHGGAWGDPFWIIRGTRAAATLQVYAHPACRGERKPALIVSYVTDRKFRPAFGPEPMMIGFSTDDQDTCNIRYAEILESYGFRFTLFTHGLSPFDGSSSPTRITLTQTQQLVASGHELGVHGIGHCTEGMSPYGWGSIIADADSLVDQTAPSYWLASLSTLDPWQYRSAAYPCGGDHQDAPEVLREHGILWCRQAGSTLLYPTDTQGVGNTGAAYTNTAYSDSSRIIRLWRPVNVYQARCATTQQGIFGNAAQSRSEALFSNPADSSLSEMLYQVIGQLQLSGNGPLMLFTHDTKTSTAYTYGIDYDELEWLCALAARNPLLGIGRSIDIIRQFRAHAYPVDPPAWTNSATHFGHTAADSLWWYSPRRF